MKYFVIGSTTALNNACGVCGIIHRGVTGVATVELKKSRLVGLPMYKKVGNRLGILEVSENLIQPSRHEALTVLH